MILSPIEVDCLAAFVRPVYGLRSITADRLKQSVFHWNCPDQENSRPKMTDSAKKLSVVMQRTLLDDRWGSVQWEAVGVVPQRDDHPFQPRLIYHEDRKSVV